MRILLVTGFAALAIWRASIDWQATIGQGYAFRMASVDGVLRKATPQAYAHGIEVIQSLGIPWLWDPVARVIVGIPLAILPATIAVLLWVTRSRARGRG